MGKRSDFARVPRDFYATPYRAVPALLSQLEPGTRFVEPCAGDGALVDWLERHGHRCIGASDIEPRAEGIITADALTTRWSDAESFVFATNPPWSRNVLHELIPHFARQAATWLLLDAGWVYTEQSIPFMPMCRRMVPIGRVKWFPGTKDHSFDDACWYLFDASTSGPITFIPRQKLPRRLIPPPPVKRANPTATTTTTGQMNLPF